MNRRRFLAASAALAVAPIQDKGMDTWRGFKVFTSGAVVNPAMWVVVCPVGSGGLLHNLSSYLISELNNRGIFVAGVFWQGCDPSNLEEDYGARYFNIGAWIADMKIAYGLTANPRLYLQSRGGIQGFSFACEATNSVDRIAALYPVTDPYVWPGRGAALSNAHNKTQDEFDALMPSGVSVISRYNPNAKAAALTGVPVCMWHGDADEVVPKRLTTDVFAPQCHAWVKTIAGFGHEEPPQWLSDEIVQYLQWGTLPPGALQQ